MKPFTVLFAILIVPSSGFAGLPDSTDDQNHATFGQLPLYFIENQGQIDNKDVAYYVKGADKTLYFTSEGITFALTEKTRPAGFGTRVSSLSRTRTTPT